MERCNFCGKAKERHTLMEAVMCHIADRQEHHDELSVQCLEMGTHEEMPHGTVCQRCGYEKVVIKPIGFTRE